MENIILGSDVLRELLRLMAMWYFNQHDDVTRDSMDNPLDPANLKIISEHLEELILDGVDVDNEDEVFHGLDREQLKRFLDTVNYLLNHYLPGYEYQDISVELLPTCSILITVI